jgi:hypothetical protein
MKKTILILTILTSFLFTSCSKSDDDPNAEYNVEVKASNLFGTWYSKETIKSNGTVIPYVNACTTKRDNITLKTDFYADFHTYLTTCEEGGTLNVGYSFTGVLGGPMISGIGFESVLYNTQITKITNKRMILKYTQLLPDGGSEIVERVYTKE